MSLLFNRLPRFVIAFLPRSKCPLISWLQAPSAVILEPKKEEVARIHRRTIQKEIIETVPDFLFFGSKIIADGDCSHEIKRCLLLGRKAMTNLDSILKNRNITLQSKVHLVKAMVFPVVMYGWESWTVKKAERRRIGAFEL